MNESESRPGQKHSAVRTVLGALWWTLAIIIILTAVLVAIGRLLAPQADRLRPWLEQRIEKEMEREVGIERVSAHWPRLTPRLILHGVRVGAPEAPELEIDQARIEFHLPNLVRPARNAIRLALLGLDIAIIQDDEGGWDWRVEGGARLEAEPREGGWMAGDLLLRDARVRLAPRDFEASFWDIPEAIIQRDGARIHLHGRIRPQGDQGSLELKLFTDQFEGRIDSIRAWLSGRDLAVHPWLSRLPVSGVDAIDESRVNLEAWLDWSSGNTARLHSRFELNGWPAAGTRGGVNMKGLILAERKREEIIVELAELDLDGRGGPPIVDGFAFGADLDGGHRAFAVRFLDLGAAHSLLAPLFGHADWMPEWLAGRIEDLELGMSRDYSFYRLTGLVQDLEMTPVWRVPGVEGVDLELALSGDRAAVRPTGQPRVDWPAMLRQVVEIDEITGRVLLTPGSIELDGLGIRHPLVEANAQGFVWAMEGKPFLDFRIDVGRAQPDVPQLWLPHGVIPAVALDWLDQSLKRVELATGDLLFHGRPVDWPAHMGAGSFSARVAFTGTDMDYWPGWPAAYELGGEVVFSGHALDAVVEAGRVADVELRAHQVHIPDMSHPVLELDLEAPGNDAAAMADLVSRMPAGPVFAHIGRLGWQGPAHATVGLLLPIRDIGNWSLAGEVEFAGVEVIDPDLELVLENVYGRMPFTREQVGPAELTANAGGEPVQIALSADLADPPELQVRAQLPGGWLLVPAIAAWLPEDDWLEGSSLWLLQLSASESGPLATLSSDLVGTRIGLPAPMAKDAGEELPFHLQLPMDPDTGAALELRMGDRFAVLARQDGGRWRFGMRWGGGEPEMPEEELFLIRGDLEILDLGGWTQTLVGLELPQAGAMDVAGSMDISVARIEIGDRRLSDQDLMLHRVDEHWRLDLDGPDVSGSLRLPAGGNGARIVAGEFSRLYLPADPDADDEDEPDSEDRPTFDADPRRLPDLHLMAADVRWGTLDLGRARIEAHAAAAGLEIERMEFDGPHLRIAGHGRWTWHNDGPVSEFDLRLNSSDLTSLFQAAGVETTLEGGRVRLELDAAWPGSPTDFNLARVDGTLDIRVNDGTIPEARPGPGRLVSLISLDALPRRLRLDFRDVFGAGLSFDRIDGSFILAGGIAVTDGVVIDSSAAKITITGATDLVNREYAQNVLVQPGLGATLPIIGAIAGGPAGAAVGLALRGLLERPLRGVSEVRYTVTGSWDDPVIELTGARPAEEPVSDVPEADSG